MKQLREFIYEKLHVGQYKYGVKNKINVQELKYFTQEDINKIIKWVNNDMPEDIRPIVITNSRKNIDWNEPSLHIYLFYNEDYEKQGQFEIPYIRFFYDEDGLTVDIYGAKDTKYYHSEKFKNSKDLNKCFDYIKSKHDIIKELI